MKANHENDGIKPDDAIDSEVEKTGLDANLLRATQGNDTNWSSQIVLDICLKMDSNSNLKVNPFVDDVAVKFHASSRK